MSYPLKESVCYVFDYIHHVLKNEDTHFHVLEHIRRLEASAHLVLSVMHHDVAEQGMEAARKQENPYLAYAP